MDSQDTIPTNAPAPDPAVRAAFGFAPETDWRALMGTLARACESDGGLAVTAAGEAAAVRLSEPVPLEDGTGVAKLIAASTAQEPLLINEGRIWGIGAAWPDAAPARLVLHGRTFWTLSMVLADGARIWFFEAEHMLSPEAVLTWPTAQALLGRIFGPLEPGSKVPLRRLMATVAAEAMGSSLVITAGAAAEAKRLTGQGLRVMPEQVGALTRLTRMDGAMVADAAGRLHGIGVILDGVVTAMGRWQRGSRFNAALSYMAQVPRPALMLIASQAGGIDVITAREGHATCEIHSYRMLNFMFT